MRPPLEAAELPADAVEVGRILDAWGIKGWFKVLPHSASPEALFSSKRWYLLPPERQQARPARVAAAASTGTEVSWVEPLLLKLKDVKAHSDSIVACGQDIADRNSAEALKGARVFVSRSSFPTPEDGEYYWVDLMGLQVTNREGVSLGVVHDLLATGPQTVLVLHAEEAGKKVERMIPFVDAFVDKVDLPARCITVDWQPDY
jgi:16S rRNA processing protein RimM